LTKSAGWEFLFMHMYSFPVIHEPMGSRKLQTYTKRLTKSIGRRLLQWTQRRDYWRSNQEVKYPTRRPRDHDENLLPSGSS
jgi:hypothetical protein